MSAPPTIRTQRSVRRKQWSDENMVSALEAVKSGMSVLRAATLYDVPKSTLRYRMKGHVKHGSSRPSSSAPGSSRPSSLTAGSGLPSSTPGSSSLSSSVIHASNDDTVSPELKVISKYLVQYVPTPKRPRKASQRVSGFRVLTSSQSLSLLEEKAQKKKAEAERKAKRKQEMDEKKRQREILKRKREEEKAVKDGSRKGKQRARENSDEVINADRCAICFRSYDDDILEETGEDWIECACGRWVHENCVHYDIVVDTSGREIICPHCVL